MHGTQNNLRTMHRDLSLYTFALPCCLLKICNFCVKIAIKCIAFSVFVQSKEVKFVGSVKIVRIVAEARKAVDGVLSISVGFFEIDACKVQ